MTLTGFNALRLFLKDLGAERTADIDPNGTATLVSLSMSADAKGRITRRRRTSRSCSTSKKDSALDEMTGLRAVLKVAGFGASAPVMCLWRRSGRSTTRRL